jgi:polyhydroxyalkanoate synthesis regulator phasin
LIRQLLLAYVGAAPLTRDEIEAFVNKLVARGALAQKDAEKLLREVWDQPGAKNVGEQMEQVLNRLDIPSRRDIEELNQRIRQLATRVEGLDKA